MPVTERKLIVMFADVSGSAGLFERLGDTEAVYAVERCLKRMNRSIGGYRGRTVQIVGDELLAIFETAEEACLAAIDMQQRIADLPPVSGLKLTIRIGLHAGAALEEDGKLSGDAINNAARIAGIARRNQILGSSAMVAKLQQPGAIVVKQIPELGTVPESGGTLDLFEVHWPSHENSGAVRPVAGPQAVMPAERLCVRYHGKAFLIDEKTPVLSLGRDLSCKLQIEDRKASRQHARIERRGDEFYLVDTSTNGCFVSLAGRQEVMVRRHEVQLDGNGKICFGSSSNDPSSDCANFEHL
jgi:adenylate cyclase